jgi:GLPGLI family protein
MMILGVGLFLALGAWAQDADKSVLEVSYEVKYRMNQGDANLRNDVVKLLVGERQSLCYSEYSRRRAFISDSLSKTNAPVDEMISALNSKSVPRGGQPWEVLKNYPKEGTMSYMNNVFRTKYVVEEPMNPFDWQLLEGDSVIAGYTCQRAEATWHGRTWRVWYTLDLPYDNGPWKLGGLPGLILAADDAAGDYHYACISIRQGQGLPIAYEGKKPEKTTQQDFQKLYTRFLEDPSTFLNQATGGQVIIVKERSGEKVKGHTPVFMEIF